MPLHDWKCEQGHVFERFIDRDSLGTPQFCECGAAAGRVFLKFPMTFIAPEIRYDSPIDGRPITNKQARVEDLARNGCVEYDPEMRKESIKRQQAADEALDKSVDALLDKEIAALPARKREKLAAEMEGGLTAEPERRTFTPETGNVSIH